MYMQYIPTINIAVEGAIDKWWWRKFPILHEDYLEFAPLIQWTIYSIVDEYTLTME